MSQLYISSALRFPRTRSLDIGIPQINGAAQTGQPFPYRNSFFRPLSPERLYVRYSPNLNTTQNGAHNSTAPAASYIPRDDISPEMQARREDEEHGATQLILLLTLSVVLLMLPWVVDHPVTLLVPVALFILPITSGALRSLVSEGFSLLAGGVRWFWRHRNTGRTYTTLQTAGPHRAAQPHQTVSQSFVNSTQPIRAWQTVGAAAFTAVHEPRPWNANPAPAAYPGQPLSVAPHSRMAAVQVGATPSNNSRVGSDGNARKIDWQPVGMQRSITSASPTVVSQQTVTEVEPPELTTPDLDFDLDSDTTLRDGKHCHASYGCMPYAHAPHAPVHTQDAQVTLMMQNCDSQYSAGRRSLCREWSTQQAECNVYNWDEADECVQRRGHRPLSDLLNNVQ